MVQLEGKDARHTHCVLDAYGVGNVGHQVSVCIGIASRHEHRDQLPAYPELVRVPGYPVYYAPQLNSNFFFYDGMYWVYQRDNWYASSWYNGPWGMVGPESVPLFVLRVPVRYYRTPPAYFTAGSRMARHAGDSTGAMDGSSSDADGTGGTEVLRQRPPRYLLTSGSIQGIDIPRRSSSNSFKARTTVTSRVTR